MQYGHFDDAAREYVITTPRTPLPWINYLGNRDFFRLVSNTSGGYAFYKDAKLLRITRYRYNNVPFDSNGIYFYVKDGNTVWNPGWQPTRTELDSYECRHGLGYTVITGQKDGICAKQETFVPLNDTCEIDRVTLTNNSGAAKSWNSASGTRPTTGKTSSATGPPARSRSRVRPSIIRPNTGSGGTTTRYFQ